MKKIEHIGIAVKDLSKANSLYEKLLGKKPYKQEEVKSENVMTSFFKVGFNKVELLEAKSKEEVSDLQNQINQILSKLNTEEASK